MTGENSKLVVVAIIICMIIGFWMWDRSNLLQKIREEKTLRQENLVEKQVELEKLRMAGAKLEKETLDSLRLEKEKNLQEEKILRERENQIMQGESNTPTGDVGRGQ